MESAGHFYLYWHSHLFPFRPQIDKTPIAFEYAVLRKVSGIDEVYGIVWFVVFRLDLV